MGFFLEWPHSMNPPPPFCWGVEPTAKFSKRGVKRISIYRGVTFLGGLQFLHLNKLKSEIFSDKKVYKQKCSSLS